MTSNRDPAMGPAVDSGTESDSAGGSIGTALWGRKWIVVAGVLLCVVAAGAYLLITPPLYTAKASLSIDLAGAKILPDPASSSSRTDNALYTQAEVIRSEPVLTKAMEAVNARQMQAFANVPEPIDWLQAGKDFRVEVGKKSDLVTVTFDAPDPNEAADFVNAVVSSYTASQSRRNKSASVEMLSVLIKERDQRNAELQAQLKKLLEFSDQNALVIAQKDRGNPVLDRLFTLGTSLAHAQIETLRIRTELRTAKSILGDPAQIRQYALSLEAQGRVAGDSSLGQLRVDLQRYELALASATRVYGKASQGVQSLEVVIESLKSHIEKVEKDIAEARANALTQSLAEAQAREEEIRKSFQSQHSEAESFSALAAQYARMEADIQRTQKRYDVLDARIMEVGVGGQEAGTLNIQVVESARPPAYPSKPRKLLYIAASLLVGLMLGCGLALMIDRMDRRLRSTQDLTLVGLPVILGYLPHVSGRRMHAQLGRHVALDSRSPLAEALRAIRTAIHFGAPKGARTILITSPASNEGKSTVASNLALTTSQFGQRTLLIDMNLRTPAQQQAFGITQPGGLCEVLAGTGRLRDVIHIHHFAGHRLDVLPCGATPANPAELISGVRMKQVLQLLSNAYDQVIIDSAPVIPVADTRILAALADVTVVVVRMNRSTPQPIRWALRMLSETGANVLGIVVNDLPRNCDLCGIEGIAVQQPVVSENLPRHLTGTPTVVPAGEGEPGNVASSHPAAIEHELKPGAAMNESPNGTAVGPESLGVEPTTG